MSDFLEARINDGMIIFGTTGGPTWKTSITQTNNGHEQRNAVWSYPLSMYDFNDRMMLDDEASAFNNFFNVVQGSAVGFRFKDWLDHNDGGRGVVNMTGAGNGTASGQLFKNYSLAGRSIQRKISKPVDGGVQIYVDGVLAAGASVNSTTGAVSLPGSLHSLGGASAVGTTSATINVPAHGFSGGDIGIFTFVGGTWASINGAHTMSVVDADTIAIAVNASGLGALASGSVVVYPQAHNAITWTGEFDVPVRFDSDAMPMTFNSANAESYGVLGTKAFTLKGLKLVELKL